MSFSSDVKNELAKQFPKSRHCQLAEIAAILEMEAQSEDGNVDLALRTENTLLFEKYVLLLKKAFGLGTSFPKEDEIRIRQALKWENAPQLWKERRVDSRLIQQTCCKRAFLRGAFMASGSISDPNKSYHLEIVCTTMEQAVQLQEIMIAFEADAKIVERKNHFVVYVKEGSQIVDMLNVMEAYVALMDFENVRILKEMRNAVNRKVNCETANISKTVNAAVKQIQDIELIRDTIGFDELPYQLREMAQLRLDYPEATLKELGNYLDPPVGKSGINHRLRKLSAIAEDLRYE